MIIKFTKHSFVFLFTFCFQSLFAQNYISLINESFDAPSSLWDSHNYPESTLKIANGSYIMEGKMLGSATTSTINVPDIDRKNFSIETKIKKISGIDDNGFGLVWASLDENNEYEFVISGNGQFKILQWEQGVKTNLIDWTYSGFINKWDGAINVLKIVESDKLLKFYINNKYVARIKALPFFGNNIGFVINETMKIAFNSLNINNIIPTEVYTPVDASINIQKVSFDDFEDSPVLKFNEHKVLKIVLANDNDYPLKDLAVMVSFNKKINDLSFDPINMIDQIDAHSSYVLSILFKADEDLPSSNNSLFIDIVDAHNNILAKSSIMIKMVGSHYNTENYNYNSGKTDTKNISNIKPYSKSKGGNAGDSCTKGCAYTSMGLLIVGLIMAILP